MTGVLLNYVESFILLSQGQTTKFHQVTGVLLNYVESFILLSQSARFFTEFCCWDVLLYHSLIEKVNNEAKRQPPEVSMQLSIMVNGKQRKLRFLCSYLVPLYCDHVLNNV